MIDSTVLQQIAPGYFDILEVKNYLAVLRSRNTENYWSLLEQEANKHHNFLISHKHKASDQLQAQKNRPAAPPASISWTMILSS